MLLVFGFGPNLLTKRINGEVEKILRLAKFRRRCTGKNWRL